MIQRVLQTVAAGVTAAGLVTFTFAPPPLGMIDVVSIAVPRSLQTAQWTATLGGNELGRWYGPTPFGPVTRLANDVLTVTGTNAVPSSQLSATIAGRAMPEDVFDYQTMLPTGVQSAAPSLIEYADASDVNASFAAGDTAQFSGPPAGELWLIDNIWLTGFDSGTPMASFVTVFVSPTISGTLTVDAVAVLPRVASAGVQTWFQVNLPQPIPVEPGNFLVVQQQNFNNLSQVNTNIQYRRYSL